MKFQQLAEHKRSSLGLCNKLLASSSLLNLEMAFLLSRTFHIWLGLIIFSIKESIFYGFLWRKCLNMCSLWMFKQKALGLGKCKWSWMTRLWKSTWRPFFILHRGLNILSCELSWWFPTSYWETLPCAAPFVSSWESKTLGLGRNVLNCTKVEF